MKKIKTVQVPMFDTTLGKIDGLKSLLHTKNRSEIIKTSIDITDLITRTITDGGQVILKDNKGNKQSIVIRGA